MNRTTQTQGEWFLSLGIIVSLVWLIIMVGIVGYRFWKGVSIQRSVLTTAAAFLILWALCSIPASQA